MHRLFLYTILIFLSTFALGSAFYTPTISADINRVVNFQTKILNKSDRTNVGATSTPCIVAGPSNDTCDFSIRIWNLSTGGTATPGNNLLFEELHQNVEIGQNNGILNLAINSVCEATIDIDHNWSVTSAATTVCNIIDDNDADSVAGVNFDRNDLWIEISFDPSGTWTDLASPPVGIEVFDRFQVSSLPSAMMTETLSGLGASAFVQYAFSSAGQTTTRLQSLINLSTNANTSNPLILVNEDGAGTPDLLDMQVASNSVFNVNNEGTLTLAGDVLTSMTLDQKVSWVKTTRGTDGSITALAQAVGTDGSVYTAGSFSSSADFGNGVNMVATSGDYFLVKHDSAGNFQWVRREVGGTGSAIAQGVAVASDGSVYTVGYFQTAAVDFGSGSLTPSGQDYFLVKHDSAGNFQWVRREVGGTGSAQAYGVAVASDGSVYTAGQFSGTVDFGSGSLVASGDDYFLIKHDSAGNFQWVRREVGGTGSAQAYGVAVASDGSVYTAGQFSGTVDFGSGSLTASGDDYFLIKHDSAGNFQWVRREVGGTGSAQAYGVAVASDGSVYTVGYFQTAAVDFGSGSLVASGDDYFLIKHDSAGNFQWVRREVGGTGSAQAYGVAVASDGSVYTAGQFSGTVDFGSGSLVASGDDYFLIKHDSAGNFQWVRREVGGTGSAQAYGVAVASDGSVYTAGYFSGTVDFGSGSLVASGDDYFLIKHDSAGNFQWVLIEAPDLVGNSFPAGVAVASDGSVYTAGQFSGTVDFGSGSLVASSNDYFLVKHDSAGNFQWVRREVGGTGSAIAQGVAVASDGSVYTVGYFQTAAVDFGSGSLTPSGQDYFLVKHDSAGNFQWVRREVGGTGSAQAYGVAVASDGSVYTAGQFSGTVDFGSGSLVASGDDYFLIKHDSAGNFQWVRREVGGTGSAQAYGVAVASDGSVYTAGQFSGTVDFGSGSLVASSNDYFLIKHDSAGNFQWVRREVGGTGSAQAYGVAVASDGSVYTAGQFSGTVDFGSGSLVASGDDYFLIKHDSAGNFQWVRREVGGTGSAQAYGVAVASDGSVYTAGYFFGGTIDFGGGLITKSGTNMFLIKLSSNGDFKWVKYPKTGSFSIINGITVNDNAVHVTGSFDSIVDFFKFLSMNAAPNTRYFTLKLDDFFSGSDIGKSTNLFRDIFVQNVRADKLYFGNNYINYADDAFNYVVGGSRVFEITSQGDIRMPNKSTKNILNSSGTNLLQITDLSQNFGAYVEAGAMISRNSYFGDEFMRKRANITVNTNIVWGDTGAWSVREQANTTNDCIFSMVDNAVNGISRMQNVQANTGCMKFLGGIAFDMQRIFNTANLPLVYMKVRPSHASATDQTWVGLADDILFTSAEHTNGLYFTNNGGTEWAGVTRNGGVSTVVPCTGQTISTTQYALLKIETRSTTDVRFYVDTDVSDGVEWFYCGSSATNVPTTNLASSVRWRSTVANRFLDTDYFRVWQDDAPAVELDMLNTLIINNSDVDLTSTEEEGGKEKEIDFEETQEEAVEELEEAEQPTQEEPVSDAGVGTEEEQAVETGEERLLRQIAEVTGLRFESIEDVGEIKISGMINGAKMQIETPELNILGNLIVSGTLIIEGDLEVRGDIKARGEIYLGRDSIGEAKIEANSTEVRVEYEEEKRKIPYVIVTPKKMMEEGYEIVDSDEKGFTIMIAEPQTEVVVFRWLTIMK